MTVADTQTPLLRTVDEEQTTERPEGLPTQIGAALLIEDQHPQAALDQFAGGHQARQAGTDNDDVGVQPCRLG